MKNNFKLILEFLRGGNASGLLLLLCAVIAILLANSPLASNYNEILHAKITLGYKNASISMSVSHWINDGLMAIFFFLVGMEIKKELLIGELKSIKTTILPIAAAIGGMIVPVVIYSICNFGQQTSNGFGIPMATDIAFALGILSLVGNKAPKGIVVFLTALAIVDDLGAIIVIAIFYTSSISWFYLICSVSIVLLLLLANRLHIKSPAVFLILGILLWFAMLKSGIHATFAGVLLGMMIPGSKKEETFANTMLHKLEHKLSPWSAYFIMPVFALTNAGVAINSSSLSTIMSTPVSVGIILGLFVGKQVGIFVVSWILIKVNIAQIPSGVNVKHIFGASVLGGIGFTMSIFVSSLAFVDETILSSAKISIITASILSAIVGIVIFKSITTESEDDRIVENYNNGSYNDINEIEE